MMSPQPAIVVAVGGAVQRADKRLFARQAYPPFDPMSIPSLAPARFGPHQRLFAEWDQRQRRPTICQADAFAVS